MATTEVLTHHSAATPAAPTPRLDVRRVTTVALPTAAALLLVAATLLDPDTHGASGTAMIRAYADGIDQLQWHASLLHFSYGLWGLIPIAMLGLVRGRGRVWASVGAALGALVVMSMPGLMISDLFFAGIANHTDVATSNAIGDEMMANQWALKTYLLPGVPSMALCLPVAFVGLVRAGKAPKWAPVAAFAGFAAFMISAGTLPGLVVAAASLVTLSVLLARAPRA